MVKTLTPFLFLTFILVFESEISLSQTLAKKEAADIMEGAIDFHVHSSPDVSARSLNDFEVAELAQKNHFKAIVIKSHVSCTTGRVVLVNLKVKNIQVFGGVVLNKAVGGINPDAVEVMHKMSPQYGKVVWFPTIDAAFNKHQHNQAGEGLTVLKDGKLTPETMQVLKIIARDSLVLATGHLSPEEIILLVPEAKKSGVNKILITHAMAAAPGLSLTQMKELVKSEAVFELTYLSVIPDKNSSGKTANVTMESMVEAIKQIGARHFIISSDMGQVGNPLPADGMKIFVNNFLRKGISTHEIKLMININPAELLGIK